MKNLRTIALFAFILGGGSIIMTLLGRPPGILHSIFGSALMPVAIVLASLGVVLFGVSFIPFGKKAASPGNGKTSDTSAQNHDASDE